MIKAMKRPDKTGGAVGIHVPGELAVRAMASRAVAVAQDPCTAGVSAVVDRPLHREHLCRMFWELPAIRAARCDAASRKSGRS
jgi:hypothetical protein